MAKKSRWKYKGEGKNKSREDRGERQVGSMEWPGVGRRRVCGKGRKMEKMVQRGEGRECVCIVRHGEIG